MSQQQNGNGQIVHSQPTQQTQNNVVPHMDYLRYFFGETPDVPGTQAQVFGHREGADTNVVRRFTDIAEIRRGFFDKPVTGVGHFLRAIFMGNAGLVTGWVYKLTITLGMGLTGQYLTFMLLIPFGVTLLVFAGRSMIGLSKQGFGDFNLTSTAFGAAGLILGLLLTP